MENVKSLQGGNVWQVDLFPNEGNSGLNYILKWHPNPNVVEIGLIYSEHVIDSAIEEENVLIAAILDSNSSDQLLEVSSESSISDF